MDVKRSVVLAALLGATVVGLAGIDLVLPGVPAFTQRFGVSVETGQAVIAAYVAGYALGLLAFGAATDRVSRSTLLIAAACGFAGASAVLAVITSPELIIAMRGLQGVCAAAPAVFTPAIVKALYDEAGATRALGALASAESLAPALAPILGVALLAWGGWPAPFLTLAVAGGAGALAFILLRRRLPERARHSRKASYRALLGSPVFLRYALSQAACLGGLLTFVFAAPAVIVGALGGAPRDFIVMQIVGITGFILAANGAEALTRRFGAERVITGGTALMGVAAVGLTLYGLSGGTALWALYALAIPFNAGLGFRGPPGFLRAIMASGGADDRASSLVIVLSMGAAAGATAAVAPLLNIGLAAAAAASAAFTVAAMALLYGLPPLPAQTTSADAHEG